MPIPIIVCAVDSVLLRSDRTASAISHDENAIINVSKRLQYGLGHLIMIVPGLPRFIRRFKSSKLCKLTTRIRRVLMVSSERIPKAHLPR